MKRLPLILSAVVLALLGALIGRFGLGPPFHRPEGAVHEPPRHHPVGLQSHIVGGPVDALEVERVLRAHLAEVRDCYDSSGAAEAGTGRLELRLQLSPNGTVSGAMARGSAIEGAFGACVEAAAVHWIFPAPTQGVASVKAFYGLELPTQAFPAPGPN